MASSKAGYNDRHRTQTNKEYCETPEQRTLDRIQSIETTMPEIKTNGILVDDINSLVTTLCSLHNTIMIIAMSRQPITPIFQA